MRFHVPMNSFSSHVETLTLKCNQKVKIKDNISGLKINPIPGRDFQTFERQGAFWITSEKLL